MPQRVPISLGIGSDQARDSQHGAARLVNCYSVSEATTTQGPHIHAISGLSSWATVSGSSDIRAMLALDSELIVVAGRQLVRVNQSGVVTSVGAIGADGYVTMARNRRNPAQVGIVAGGSYYVYANGAVSQIQDADLESPNSITALDGYFVLFSDSGRFSITSIDEATEIDGLDFSNAEANPDGGVRCAVRNRDLVLFGTKTTEFWSNSGGEFPFTRQQTIEVGCHAAGSVANVHVAGETGVVTDTLVWAGTDASGAYSGIYVLGGYTPAKISTRYIDRIVEACTDPTALRSQSWTEGGHSFYSLTGPGVSICYDATERKWHERTSAGLSRWRPSSYAYFAGKHLFGDYQAGAIYQSSPETHTEAGADIVMTIQTPPVTAWPGDVDWHALHIDMTTGVGDGGGAAPTDNPDLMLDWSDDGGNHWHGQRLLKLGQLGQPQRKLTTYNMGRSRMPRTYRLSMSAAVQRTAVQMQADITIARR